MNKIVCPHCSKQFETTQNCLEAFNIEAGATSATNPEETINGYKIFFTGLVLDQRTVDLVGWCVAGIPGGTRHFVVQAGTKRFQSLNRWEVPVNDLSGYFYVGDIDGPPKRQEIIASIRESMEYLKSNIRNLPVAEI